MARCLALANALQRRRYQMTFLSRIDNPGWPDRIRRFRHTTAKVVTETGDEEDRSEFLREIARRSPVMVVTDSPIIDEEYLATLSPRVQLVISLDDRATQRFPGDLVLNPTLAHSPDDYDVYPGVQVVAGNKYAMIRAEFRRARNVRATEPSGPPRVLLSLGGGAVARETAMYAKALLSTNKIARVDAVIGSSNEGKEELDELLARHGEQLTVSQDVRDLGIRMTKAHLLVTGGGNTCLEAACVGVPMIVVARRPDQEANAARLEEAGACHYLGKRADVDGDMVNKTALSILEDTFERKAMCRSGRMLIDGRGADRIVTATEILLRRSRKVKALAAA